MCAPACDSSQAAEFLLAGGFAPAHWLHCAAPPRLALQPLALGALIYMTKWEPARLCHGELRYAEEPLCLPAVWVAFFSPSAKGGTRRRPLFCPLSAAFPYRVLAARGEQLLGPAHGFGGLGRGLQQGSEHSGAGTWCGEGLVQCVCSPEDFGVFPMWVEGERAQLEDLWGCRVPSGLLPCPGCPGVTLLINSALGSSAVPGQELTPGDNSFFF